MLDDRYYFSSSEDFLTFEFESAGPMGIITKAVHYTKINAENSYNLGFGDKDKATGFVNDLIVTNNQDSRKVLTTVSKTLHVFTEKYPDAIVIAMGSTKARTRLYQIGIANNLADIREDFDVLGFTNDAWEPFQQNTTYLAFSVRRKEIVL